MRWLSLSVKYSCDKYDKECSIVWILLINLTFAENGTEEVKSICEAVENTDYFNGFLKFISVP